MADQYKSHYPPSPPVPTTVREFFEAFYAVSDTPDAHEEYAGRFFTPDATLIMASKSVTGQEEILALRKSLWTHVRSRSHKPIAVFPFVGGRSSATTSEEDSQAVTELEVMLHGTVSYTYIAGGEGELPWAARAVLVFESPASGGIATATGGDTSAGTESTGEGTGGVGVKMRFYQVYLDTAAQKPRT